MSKLEDLKTEAKELGLQFSPNIGEAKLQAKIDEYYEAQETPDIAVKQALDEVNGKTEEVQEDKNEPKKSKKKTMGELAREMEESARKTKIVTIIDNDQRVNNQTTSCTVNCGNEWFDLGQKILPLNLPVEVMQGHLDVLKEVRIPQHVKDQKTGLSRVTMRPRYTISYEDIKPSED